MARILIHTLVFAPDGVSTAYLMTDLAHELKRRGHSITVLTSTPHYNLDSAATARQPIEAVWPHVLYKSNLDGITVWHVRMKPKGQRTISRVKDFIGFHLISLLACLFFVGRYDIVIAPSPPLTMGIVSWLMGRRWRAPSIYNVQEVYPDFAINQGILKNSVLIRAMRMMERMVYSKSSFVVTISEQFRRTLLGRGVPDNKLVVIPNFVDTEFCRPLPRHNRFSEEHGLDDSFVVLYAGNIGLSQDWESLLFSAERLSNLPIRFVITGDGARREWLVENIRKRGLGNINYLGFLSGDLMPYAYASSDICMIPMKAATTSDTFPSKIYTIMAYVKPAIVSADNDSDLAAIIRNAGCGRVVLPENPQAFYESLLRAFEEKQLLPEEGQNGRRYVEKEHSKETVVEKYDRLISEALE